MNAVRAFDDSRATGPAWSELNQRWLVARLERLHAAIEHRLSGNDAPAPETAPPEDGDPAFVSALTRCTELFGLSAFECDVLLLVAGVELDAGLRQAVARAQTLRSETATGQPSFSLAFAVLDGAHWDALSPQSPLRYWRLLAVDDRGLLTAAPLRADERILHFLTGVAAGDERLQGLARFMRPSLPYAGRDDLPDRIAHFLSPLDGRPPLAILDAGGDAETTREVALAAAVRSGGTALWLHAGDLPTDVRELADLARVLDREIALSGALPVLQTGAPGDGQHAPERQACRLLALMHCAAVLLGQPEPTALAELGAYRVARFRPEPRSAEAATATAIARSIPATTDTAFRETLSVATRRALQQFRLGPRTLDAVLEQVAVDAHIGISPSQVQERVWRLCREAVRGGLDTLAQRIDACTRFEDIVLPPAQMQMLREIGSQLRHRHVVHEDWGFAAQSNRGLGLCALFAGESGTGKTMAAEAIANEVGLDLYRIDLASVVSKYIGETEKNLKRVFDAAEASGAVLLFDEADALFGKRSDVKDSHDRYANVEIAYLLQRIEAYRGLAILTTNLRSALDRAFLRRIRFIVQFPFPDLSARAEIWQRVFPPEAPVADLDPQRLAHLQLSGGHIRNIAINAAFAAAGDGGHITHRHLATAAHAELVKLERHPDRRVLGDRP